MTSSSSYLDSESPYQRCTAPHPCPICNKPDWCQIIDGSLVQCMREKKGSFKTIQQSDGNEAHLHRHPDAPQQFDAVSIMAPPGRADPTFLDVVYQALLQFLPISSKSPRRSGLLERGFSEKDILRFGYRDYPEAKPLGFGATS